jgi:hypothetical protein
MRTSQYSFYRVGGTSIVVTDQVSTAGSSPSVATLETLFQISSTAEIHNLLSGYFDRVDGRQIAHLDDPNLAVPVDAPIGCVIEGWVASGDFATARSMDEVYAVVNRSLVKAQIVRRPDVGQYLKNPALNNSGYRVYLDSKVLHPGMQGIKLIGFKRGDGKLYRFPRTLYLDGQ